MIIHAIQCPGTCGTIIYSRANHDFHHCDCGEIFIDGGPNSKWGRWGFKKKKPISVKIKVDATIQDLYDDWNYRRDVYGWVRTTELGKTLYDKEKKTKVPKKAKRNSRTSKLHR